MSRPNPSWSGSDWQEGDFSSLRHSGHTAVLQCIAVWAAGVKYNWTQKLPRQDFRRGTECRRLVAGSTTGIVKGVNDYFVTIKFGTVVNVDLLYPLAEVDVVLHPK